MNFANKDAPHTSPQDYSPKKPEIVSLAKTAADGIHIEKGSYSVKQQNGGSYIDGVPMLQWGQHRDSTYCGAIAMAAEVMDIPVSYETLMGVSGLCYRFAMKPDWCPSSQLVQNGPVWDENINAALGIAPYSIADENERKAKMIDQLDRGIPIISMGQISSPEWDLLTGYAEDGKVFFGRSYFDEQESNPDSPYCRAENNYYTDNKYRKAEGYPGMVPEMFTKFLDVPCEKKPAIDLLKSSLEICLHYYTCEPCWGHQFGNDAYDLLIQGLLKENQEYESFCRNENYHVGSLADTRLCASVYLNNSVSLLQNSRNKEKLTKAAELYRGIYDSITSVTPYETMLTPSFNAGPMEPWSHEVRQSLVAVLTQAMETEAKIQEIVKDILEHWIE